MFKVDTSTQSQALIFEDVVIGSWERVWSGRHVSRAVWQAEKSEKGVNIMVVLHQYPEEWIVCSSLQQHTWISWS